MRKRLNLGKVHQDSDHMKIKNCQKKIKRINYLRMTVTSQQRQMRKNVKINFNKLTKKKSNFENWQEEEFFIKFKFKQDS